MRLGSALCIAIVTASAVCDAQTQGSIDSRITATIARMAGKDLATREAALSELAAEVSEGQKGGDNSFLGCAGAVFRAPSSASGSGKNGAH